MAPPKTGENKWKKVMNIANWSDLLGAVIADILSNQPAVNAND